MSAADLSLEQLMQEICWDVLEPLPHRKIKINPVKYEIAVHRIGAILREGCYALVRTSGSPIVTEVGEYMFAIYDALGHAALVTAGVLPHLVGTEGGIKLIRTVFGEDIEDGDQFIINDPYVLGIHTPDVLVAKPIFHGRELVCWIGCLTHSSDIGAKDPGGVADSTDIFQEGLRLPGMKIMRRGKRAEEVFRLIKRSVRNPDIMDLDVSSKIAGNNVVHARLQELITREGPEFIADLLQKMIQETADRAMARIEKIPDGFWHNRIYGDHTGLDWQLIWCDVQAKKAANLIHLDLSQSSPQQPGPVNTPLAGAIGSIFSVLVSTLFWDLNWNKGIVAPVRIKVAEGSLYNPKYPAPCYGAPPTTAALLAGNLTRVVSEMSLGVSDATVCAPWMSSQYGCFMGGISQHGRFDATATFDANGGGTGATLTNDGDDTAAFILAPGAMMADVESYEARFPLLYLFRRKRENSGGYGKYQGGLGGEAGVMIHGTDTWKVGFRTIGHKVASTIGILGGYPADSSVNGYVHREGGSKLSIAERNKLLCVADLLKQPGAEVTTPIIKPSPLKDGDIYFHRWSGGGGVGDPLTRDIARIAQDLEDGKVTYEAAEKIYGVKFTGEAIDVEATKKEREARAARSKALGRGGEGKRYCLHCGTFTEVAATHDRQAKELLHTWVDDAWMFYREYFCSKCGGVVEVEAIAHAPSPTPSPRGRGN